jgi:hypothetical protein
MKNAIGKALSNTDIMDLIKHKANLMTYRKLKKYKTLDQALGKHGALVLLYETQENFGHWVCVFKRGDLIEHFDSYGMKPDDEIKFIDSYFRKRHNLHIPHLTALLYESPYKISYNEHKLQKHKEDVNTCGRWVIARLLLRHLPLKQFSKMFKNKSIEPDKLVTFFTEILRHK